MARGWVVTWHTSSDVHAFLAAAGTFLKVHPIDHTLLLTEAAYLAARPSEATDQQYGWWQPDGGDTAAAFLHAPRHRPMLSIISADALESLVELLPDLPPVGVDGRLVDLVVTAWRRRWGIELSERSRIKLYRLGHLQAPEPRPGFARVATLNDRELLVTWYEQLMAANPNDPSDLSYMVDDPISYAGIVLWEVDGTPKAMTGRSRLVAGMVRLGPVYAPQKDGDGEAALGAACVAARAVARDVLIFASATDTATDATYRTLGFEPVLERVMLVPQIVGRCSAIAPDRVLGQQPTSDEVGSNPPLARNEILSVAVQMLEHLGQLIAVAGSPWLLRRGA